MSCLLTFIASIELTGVEPQAYSRFVDYTTETLLPVDNTLAQSTLDLFSGIAAATLLSVIAIVVMTIVLIIIILVSLGMMEVLPAFYVLAFVIACLAIYFAIGYTFTRKAIAEVAIPLQQDVRETTILTANSVIRDLIYLTLQK